MRRPRFPAFLTCMLLFGRTSADARTLSFFGGDMGHTVATDATHVIVGGPRSSTAYLLDASGGIIRMLHPERALVPEDRFAQSAQFVPSGSLVGAPGAAVGDVAGAGVVFEFDPDGFFVREIPNPDPHEGDAFGFSIVSVGGFLVVGAPGFDDGGADAGAIFVFDASTAPPSFVHAIPAPVSGGAFGYAVAAYGSRVLVGAPRPGSEAPGAAYVVDPVTGAVTNTFSAGQPDRPDLFGAAVAALSDDVVVGAPLDGTVATQAGRVYVYDHGSSLAVRALDGDPVRNALFGAAIATRGTSLLVGSPGATEDVTLPSGSFGGVSRFEEPDFTRSQLIRSPLAESFGSALAVDPAGTRLVVGSPGSGRISVYAIDDTSIGACFADGRDPGEACDDTDDSACYNACQSDCTCGTPAVCGDGIRAGHEQCDDHNNVSCDGCSSSCFVESGYACGDGQWNIACGEQCDDFNTDPDDGCSPNCKVECADASICDSVPLLVSSLPAVPECRLTQCIDGECDVQVNVGATCAFKSGFNLCCTPDGQCSQVCQVFCEDGDPCTDDIPNPGKGSCDSVPRECHHPCLACNSGTGQCELVPGCSCPEPCAGTQDCDDHDALTDDSCTFDPVLATQCCEHTLNDCAEDDDPCTELVRDHQLGCVQQRIENCCDDDVDCDDACTTGRWCRVCNYCGQWDYHEPCCDEPEPLRAQCRAAGTKIECNDHNECTIDACDPHLGCTHTAKPNAPQSRCGDVCRGDVCVDGTCTPAVAPCVPPGPCWTVECDPTGSPTCTAKPIDDCCDDAEDCASPCVVEPQCTDGECSPPDKCPDVDMDCVERTCDPSSGACIDAFVRDGTSCESGRVRSECLPEEVCAAGECTPVELCRVHGAQADDGGLVTACLGRKFKIDVDCTSVNDAVGSQRGYCKASGTATIGGNVLKVTKKPRKPHRLNPSGTSDGRATFQLRLTKRGRRELCSTGALLVRLDVTVHSRTGHDANVSLEVPLSP